MNDKDKKILIIVAKSMHKAFFKALNYNEHKTKGKGKYIVTDVLDGNMKPEGDPDEVPSTRTGVMNKGKYTKEELAKKVAETVVKKYKEHKK